jgi:anti-sigma regulatory factor (Ser/Thr protein kinase)
VEVTAGITAVAEATHVAEARRRAADIARMLSLDETTSGRVALVVTEMATNLLKHAGGGELFVGVAWSGERIGVQIIAMDRGAGMANVSASLVDGFSTAGSTGTGLGAIQRASDSFDIYSSDTGTVAAASVYADRSRVPPSSVGAVCVPVRGERECGDAWATWSAGGLTSVFVVDGLGHGHEAAIAAEVAVNTFRRHAERPAPDVIALVHAALKPTRGAAVALAELDERAGTLRYCAIGNISAVVVRGDGHEQHLISLPGIAGHVARRVQTFSYDWPRSSLLVMHSDGVGTHWSLSRYAGLQVHRPDVVAGVLYRDHRRGADDATAVVTRHGEAA